MLNHIKEQRQTQGNISLRPCSEGLWEPPDSLPQTRSLEIPDIPTMWNHTHKLRSRLRSPVVTHGSEGGDRDIHTLKCIEKERMRTQCRVQGWEWSIPQEGNTSTTEKKNLLNHVEPFLLCTARLDGRVRLSDEVKNDKGVPITCKDACNFPGDPMAWSAYLCVVLWNRRPLSPFKNHFLSEALWLKICLLPGVPGPFSLIHNTLTASSVHPETSAWWVCQGSFWGPPSCIPDSVIWGRGPEKLYVWQVPQRAKAADAQVTVGFTTLTTAVEVGWNWITDLMDENEALLWDHTKYGICIWHWQCHQENVDKQPLKNFQRWV